MEEYLQPTKYIDYEDPIIQETIDKLDLDGLSDIEKAKKLFYHVRDSITYSARITTLNPKIFKASYTIQQDESFCIPKALTLCALTRAVGIPSRIHLVDFYNHRLSEKLENIWGTKVMAGHCYSEIYLNDKWIKATPSLDLETCNNHDFIPIEFDGKKDAIINEVDKKGRKHAEYINDHGTYPDLPLQKVMSIFEENYGPLSQERIEQVFSSNVSEFQMPNQD